MNIRHVLLGCLTACAMATLPACKMKPTKDSQGIYTGHGTNVTLGQEIVQVESGASETPLSASEDKPLAVGEDQPKHALGKQGDQFGYEGDACQPEPMGDFDNGRFPQANCHAGLACVINIVDMDSATCRLPCGTREGPDFVKQSETCPEGRTCQLLNFGVEEQMGAYCLPPQTQRDGMCFALDDHDACTDGRQCAISNMQNSEEGAWFSGIVCRDRCPFGDANSNSACQQGETCRPDKYSQEQQMQGDRATTCSMKECAKRGNPLCACDAKRSFVCRSPMENAERGSCIRPAGLCVEEVAGTVAADLANGGLQGCNEVSDHRFCNSAAYQDERGKSYNRGRCKVMSDGGEGICLDVCASQLEGISQSLTPWAMRQAQCGVGYECNAHFAKALFKLTHRPMVVAMMDSDSLGNVKKCNPAVCQPNETCPQECGHEDTFCVEDGDGNGEKGGICATYLNTCEPIAQQTPAE